MVAKNFANSLVKVGISEGGFTLNRADRGNYTAGKLIGTNHGISAPVLREWLGRIPTRLEMQNLAKSKADRIYRAKYYDAVRFNDMPSGLDHALVDYAINSGPNRAIKELQRVLGITADGVIGPVTMRTVNKADTADTIRLLMKRRLSFLQRLRSWKTFGRGWKSRVLRVEKDALTMIDGEC